jgi:hypothetical protein
MRVKVIEGKDLIMLVDFEPYKVSAARLNS